MPSPTLDATLAGANSNTYALVATADAHFANLLSYGEWDSLDEDTKGRALVSATQEIEQLDFWGDPVSTTQALKFPRICGVVDGTSMPPRVIAAVAELALKRGTESVAGSGGDFRGALRAAGVVSYRLGDHSETYGQGGGLGEVSGSPGTLASMPASVQRLLSGWVKMSANSDSGRQGYTGNYDRHGLWWPDELLS